MTDSLCRVSTKRLMAYSAAAGVGAFAFGASAQANVQVNNALNGVNIVGANVLQALDIDGNLVDDALINNGINGIQALPAAVGTTILSDNGTSADPQSYYVIGFFSPNGGGSGVIGPDSRVTGGGANLTYLTLVGGYSNFYYYHHVDDGAWIGVAFDIAGNNHFGAIEVLQQSGHRVAPFDNNLTINITLGRMIWEDQPNVAIFPEPTSLSLLAVGTGAVGLRRRRKALDN